MLIVLVPMALVFQQPDLGTSLVYGVIWVSVMTLAQLRKRYWVAVLVAAPAAVLVAWEFLLADYQKRRWTVFLNPEADARGDGSLFQNLLRSGPGDHRHRRRHQSEGSRHPD